MGKPGRPAVERTGQLFGLVRCLKRQGSDRHGQARWLIRCEGKLPDGSTCGVERVVSGRSLDECEPTTHQGCNRARRAGTATACPGPAETAAGVDLR